jgi:hypothetical protein
MPHLELVSQPIHKLLETVEKANQEDAAKLLETAGLGRANRKNLKAILADNNLDTEAAIGVISGIAHGGDSDTIRLRAAEMALKLSGDLVQEQSHIPVVNLIINDSQKVEINPILLPRV